MKKKTLVTIALVGGISYLLYKRSQPLGYFPGDDAMAGLGGFGSFIKKVTSGIKKNSPKAFLDRGHNLMAAPVKAAVAGNKSKGNGQSFGDKMREAAAAKKAKKAAAKAAREAARAAARAAGQTPAQQTAAGDSAAQQVESQPDAAYTSPAPYQFPPPSYIKNSGPSEDLVIRSTEENEYGDSSSAGSPGLPPIATTVETTAPEYETAVPAAEAPSSGGSMIAGAGLAVAAAFAMLAK